MFASLGLYAKFGKTLLQAGWPSGSRYAFCASCCDFASGPKSLWQSRNISKIRSRRSEIELKTCQMK
ncbi:unnamed protein product [Callosobruchus maculatus]|uniref:Uncharacterized protein n=1 Tax=Callosobruchus maculatus TaxID=64391 RepID=A0A653BY05_CALMS|nr:unnamed protein product [Callosobruchus maculatus]